MVHWMVHSKVHKGSSVFHEGSWSLIKQSKDTMTLPYVELHLVDHCNLGCAGCSHFAPLAPPWYALPAAVHADLLRCWCGCATAWPWSASWGARAVATPAPGRLRGRRTRSGTRRDDPPGHERAAAAVVARAHVGRIGDGARGPGRIGLPAVLATRRAGDSWPSSMVSTCTPA